MIKALKHWLFRKPRAKKQLKTGCLCCGDCCEAFGWHLNASKADLERWRLQGREDLLERVNRLGWIWINPQTGRSEDKCPFIKRLDDKTASCSIHETKPAMCRDYPTLAHGHQCLRGWFLKC